MRWRFRIGSAVFVLGLSSPVLIPVVAASDLPSSTKAVLSGLLAVGIPEVLSPAAVAILGKEGFDRLKQTALRLLKRHGPPEKVSAFRYHRGIALFAASFLFGWAAPYASHFIPALDAHELYLAFAGDALLVSSLFLLGGEFWNKLRALFHHGAHAVSPERG